MSLFGALAGGADCGPSNPLAQISKTYAQDRGVQQDHFGPKAGSSNQLFRQNEPPSSSNPEAVAQFFNQHQQQPHHSFDLSPLDRSLPHSQFQPQQQVPAWAQAFQSSSGGARAMELDQLPPEEQAKFMRAFSGGGNGEASQMQGAAGPAWSGEFGQQRVLGGGTTGQGMDAQEQQARMGDGRTQMGGFNYHAASYGGMGMGMGGMGMGMGMSGRSQMMGLAPGMLSGFEQPRVMEKESLAIDWETAFLAQESSSISRSSAALQHEGMDSTIFHDQQDHLPNESVNTASARDALAQTAGALLDTVTSTEEQRNQRLSNDQMEDGVTSATRDKFAQSTFLDLMRKLRDGEVAVEGDKVVEQIGPNVSSLSKGKQREESNFYEREEEGRIGGRIGVGMGPQRSGFAPTTRDLMNGVGLQGASMEHATNAYSEVGELWDDEDRVREGRERVRERKVQFQGDGGLEEEMLEEEANRMRMDTRVPFAQEEDFDASFIAGGHGRPAQPVAAGERSAQQKEWDVLQEDWDQFEATSTGLKSAAAESATAEASTSTSIAGYNFAQNNPYLVQQPTTRTHSLHSTQSTYDSILEKEAAVQQNPLDPGGWLALGIKQQENEREDMAIQALHRALELDPTTGDAYLALAVSYTNENERALAYDSIDKWIDSLGVERYPRQIENYRDLFGRPRGSLTERGNYLTNLLIILAQSRAEKNGADVDADVQIGLGVLFNTSEEYDKAGDCFESALSVRPDDPLLFNRLGATLANSGKTELAIQYYLEALELQPTYVRARFNLAVANMNLSHYPEAVEHLLTALSIQESDPKSSGSQDSGNNPSNGVTSQTLWDSLNIALLMMQRSDLAVYTTERNLSAFRLEFPNAF